MIKYFLSFVFFLLLLNGCSFVGSQQIVEINNSGHLIPLVKGNTWTLERRTNGQEPKIYTATVGERTNLSGHVFYELIRRDSKGNIVSDDTYFRNDDKGTYTLYHTGKVADESIFLKYPVEDGETYEYTDVRGISFTYHVDLNVVSVPAGRFEAYVYSGYDPSTKVAVHPGVGIIKISSSMGSDVLVSYGPLRHQ